MTQSKRNIDSGRGRSDSSETGPSTTTGHSAPGNGSDARPDAVAFTGPPRRDVLRLSAAQRGIWFAQHLAGSSPISVAQYVEIVGELQPELLLEACQAADREFGPGHLHLIEVDGEPCQYVDETNGSPASVVDLRRRADPVATAHRLMVED